jgi:hypothetical protein
MPVKQIVTTEGKRFSFGRRRPIATGPEFKLKNYVLQSLPTPPPAVNYTKTVRDALGRIYMNDTLGICVIADIAHRVGVLTGNSGSGQYIFTDAELIALYSAIGGYIPGDPSTDNGCDPVTAWAYWQNNGAPKGLNQIAGSLTVDATNWEEVCTALYLFENVSLSMELPDAWISPFPSSDGFVWDVDGPPDQSNGHEVAGVSYEKDGVIIDSWGMLGRVTIPALAKYCVPSAGGALYTAISPEGIIKATQKAPNGFAFSQLVADFNTMGGHLAMTHPEAVEALEKLARLGNGDQYGNSDGNRIAQQALAKIRKG